MALEKEYLESLGLEIAKRKYYNAAKVENVIEGFARRSAELESETAALRERAEAASSGTEEIGEAILSARSIARQLIAEAKEEADRLVAEAREEAECRTAEAKRAAEEMLLDAQRRSSASDSRLANERQAFETACTDRERQMIEGVQEGYLRLREEYLGAVRRLDEAWQSYLCSFGERGTDAAAGGEEPDGALPGDLTEKVRALAESLSEIGAADGDES